MKNRSELIDWFIDGGLVKNVGKVFDSNWQLSHNVENVKAYMLWRTQALPW